MRPLVIVGAGGLGRGTAFLVEQINAAAPAWDLRGFVDDDASLAGERVQGLPVLGDVVWLAQQRALHYVIAIGAPVVRRRLARRLAGADLEAATLVHPSARPLHASTQIGAGSIMRRGVASAVAVTLGPHAVVNMNATLGHDARLASFVTLHPGVHLSGHVHLEAGVEMGTGAVALPSVTVGERAVVGAGGVVHRDLPAGCTAVGVPAQPLAPSSSLPERNSPKQK